MGLFSRLFGKKAPIQKEAPLEPKLEPQKAPEAPKTKPVPTLEKVSQDIDSGKVASMKDKTPAAAKASTPAKKPAAKKPAAKKPAAKKPASSTVKKPATKKPTAKKPAVKK